MLDFSKGIIVTFFVSMLVKLTQSKILQVLNFIIRTDLHENTKPHAERINHTSHKQLEIVPGVRRWQQFLATRTC